MKIFFPELSQGQLFVFLKNFTKLKESNELPPQQADGVSLGDISLNRSKM